MIGLRYLVCKLTFEITCFNVSNIRYAESPSEEDGADGSGGSDALDAESGGKATNKLNGSVDADDSLLVRESQASKKDVAGVIRPPCICFY